MTLGNFRRDLLKEWDYQKNVGLDPNKIAVNSRAKVWWICSKGHSFSAIVSNRTIHNTGCGICANRKILVGYNDLLSTYPEVAAEWHPIRNGGLKPTDVVYGSAKKVWWKCKKGHEWEAIIRMRTTHNQGCRYCSHQTSYPELTLYNCIKRYYARTFHRAKVGGYEYDIYIPELRLAIEYNGIPWHKSDDKQNKLEMKRIFANSQNVRLLVIHEIDSVFSNLEDDDIYYGYSKNKYDNLQDAMDLINQYIINVYNVPCNMEINNNDRFSSASLMRNNTAESLAVINPEAAKDWIPELNGGLTSYDIHAGSGMRANFKCHKCGYQWINYVRRHTKGNRCPICNNSNFAVAKGINDLATLQPLLCKEWHYTKNNGLLPTEVKSKSNKKVWWKCSKCGHEWEAYIWHRTEGSGCPECGYRITSGL